MFLICAGFSYSREYVEKWFEPCFACCQCDHADPFSDCINASEKDTNINAMFLAKQYGIKDIETFINDAELGIYDSDDSEYDDCCLM